MITEPVLPGWPGARAATLTLAAAAAGWVCGGVLQDSAAGEEAVHLNPRVAALLARHLWHTAAHDAAGAANLVLPPGLWIIAPLAVMGLDVVRRGRSTLRFAVVTGASLAAAGMLDQMLPRQEGYPPVTLGAAIVAALAVSVMLFTGRWLDRARAVLASAAVCAGAAGFVLALVVAGQPFTAVAAGSSLGTAVAAAVEAAACTRWGRWLTGQPPGPTGSRARAPGPRRRPGERRRQLPRRWQRRRGRLIPAHRHAADRLLFQM